MPLLNATDRKFLQALSRLSYCNPFLPERMELERVVLGSDFDEASAVWSLRHEWDGERANVERLTALVEPMAERLREELAGGASAERHELLLYEDLILYLLYYRFRDSLRQTIEETKAAGVSSKKIPYWRQFRETFDRFLRMPGRQLPTDHDPAHIFAGFFQMRRAFHHIYHSIIGGSLPAAQLRATVWQSIFTHDLRRYRRTLFATLGDVTTLVAGPSGTGKELVARAVGMSRYIPFDVDSGRFSEDFAASFHALNLSALSPTLIESELFGHCRGAFTGAVSDRQGWLEVCGPLGTVFLDEIGELDAAIQVKLLRVLETRTFQRLGETALRRFHGKIIAATNRDLAAEMREGRFRQDFYYRLCSDMITTPSLKDQLADSPDDLHNLLLFIADRVAGDEAEPLAAEVEAWIDQHIGRDYDWPGNIRELEQCVRNVMIRGRYLPSAEGAVGGDWQQALIAELQTGALSADELLRLYCTIAYSRLGSYEQTAKQLKLDRRTVKSKIDEDLLKKLKGNAAE